MIHPNYGILLTYKNKSTIETYYNKDEYPCNKYGWKKLERKDYLHLIPFIENSGKCILIYSDGKKNQWLSRNGVDYGQGGVE